MEVVSQVMVLFLLIVTGVITKKLGIVTDKVNRELGKLIMNVTLPAFIVVSMNYEFSYEALMESMNLLVISFCVYGAAIILSKIVVKLLKLNDPRVDIYQYVMTFSNVGYMGYPVVAIVFGKIGVFYAAIYNLSFNLLVYTYGVYLMSRSKHVHAIEGKDRIKNIFNPGLVAVILGFAMFLTSYRLPNTIFRTLDMIGSITTPLSMMFIGFLLSELRLKDLFNEAKDYVVIAIRLLVMPIIVGFTLWRMGMSGYVLGIPVLITAMPAAANTAVFAELYENDAVLASKLIFISTLISVGTIPIFMIVLQLLS